MSSLVGKTIPPISGLIPLRQGQHELVSIGSPVNPGQTKVTVVEFWATWCPPCRDSIPHLSELQERYKAKEVEIIGITWENDENKLRHFVNSMEVPITYTVVMDPTQTTRQSIYSLTGAQGIPFALILVNNEVKYQGHPMDSAFATELDKYTSMASVKEAKPKPIHETYEQLMQRHPGELRKILEERGISTKGLLEKKDFAKEILDKCGP
ncbi:uncharacterized protein VTP21DRAFT_7080 [Calcarisporiella thermophila]|uniref:uncharacterized protein n=1 Tax=Calcarisporiella thermophila TaxID=911321 RepID=UPI003742CDA7